MYTAIRPGQEWLDTNGKRIEAHGGKLFFEGGTFYWYGENKEKTDGKNSIWTYGIRAYSSQDLYNWQDEGLIIPPNLEDEQSNLHPNQRVDRPHILYNEETGKYVCWIKISGDAACFVILTADRLLGPYEVIKENYRPFGKKVGDFDLAVDEETKQAHLHFESDHKNMTSTELTADYLDVKADYVTNFDGMIPPFIREAPAYVKRNGRHYLLTSGLTNYVPNPSEAAIAAHHLGPYKVMGNLHPEDESRSSYNSQISGIFKHPEKDLYIALADRWVPDYVMTAERYDILSRVIAARFDERYTTTDEEKKQLMGSPILGNVDTSKANYVWLPIEWEGDRPIIRWHEEWRIEDY
ncbi:family 43 glycosylhydrolase [Trichococcus ilyis]|uniref:Glycosyl hydrolases family 43 n=1 Tax=Trichococcus ilyis TaxID=640938 RepID=A0A143YTM9_9LACT|nr:family 43 glycosylhydrolase [Trichococcus ilyis]CZQ96526.1 Hypothetical protein TR210_1396 [Trichococcus ilyis]SEJ51967.1 Glycosyl hydrolases family 43 [Trichococcus ilyis]